MALNRKFGQVAINDGGGGYSAAINRRRTRESEEAYNDFYSKSGIFTQGEIIDYAKANGLDGEQLEGLMNNNDRRRKWLSDFVGGMTADTSDLDIIYGLGRTTSEDFSDADVDRLIAYRDWLKNNAGMPSSYEDYLKNHAGNSGAGTNSGTGAGTGTNAGAGTNANTGAGTAGAGSAGSAGAGGSTATDAANAYYDAVFGKTADYAGKQRDTTRAAAQEYYDYITGAAGKDRDAAIRAAEAARERGIVDASTAYRQMLASYGANAEKLAGMGLTGSGYSDYLSGKAYATSRAEAQNANKEADAAIRSAESSYSQALGQAKYNKMMAEADADNTYSQALLNAEISRDTGKYEASTAGAASGTSNYNRLRIEITGDASDDDIAAYADEYGFTPEQVAELTRIRDNKKSSAAESTRTEGFNSVRMNITADTGDYEIEAAAGTYGLTAEQKQELYRIRDEKKKQEDRYSLGLDSDSNALAKADELLKNNTISQEEAHSIYDKMIFSAIASATKDDIENFVKELYGYKKAGKITDEMYSKYLTELGRVTSNLKAVNKAKKNVEAEGKEEHSGDRGGQFTDDVTDAQTLRLQLNAIATGDARRTPSIGRTVTLNGKKYTYTAQGWTAIES